jgi:penicillin-binding protein A
MNSRIRRLALALLVCYLALFVQLNVLQAGPKRQELAADPRNTRQTVRDFNSPRGPIISADGVVVAQTVPAVDSRYDYQRVYPTGELFSDITGYFTLNYGSTRLERTQNQVLAGRTAAQQLQWVTSLFRNTDTTGAVRTTTRVDLQQVARDALGDREGSVVLLDTRTGAVLAMWSYPTFDPNLIAVHDSQQAGSVIDFYNLNPAKPLLGNAFQERYMPGSAFKVVTTGIALEEGVIDLGSYWEPEREFLPPQTTRPLGNYRGSLCGGDLTEVFRRSCNTPFARTAVELGPERMLAGTEAWGFEEPLPFDLPGAAASTFAPEIDFSQNLPVLALQGFGQGSVQLVPLHMAMVAAAVANGGIMMQPYVVDATLDHEGRVLERTRPEVWKRPISTETSRILTDLMVEVVNDGTARCCMQLANGEQAAAKTGTAQLNATGEPERSHAWIMAFAPAEAPRVAVAVILKGTSAEISAGTGGTLAGPVAKQVLDAALVAIPA